MDERIESISEIRVGDVLATGSFTAELPSRPSRENLMVVGGFSSVGDSEIYGFYGHFVNPNSHTQLRVADDRSFHVHAFELAFGEVRRIDHVDIADVAAPADGMWYRDTTGLGSLAKAANERGRVAA